MHGDLTHPGDVTKVTDANNEDWLYGYDAYGNVTSTTDPDSKTATTTYDLIGRPVTSVSPRGNESGATPFDFQSSITYDLSSRPTVSFGPTAAGFADSFGRVPSWAGLGTADSGQSWTATTGVWGRDGGAYPVSGSNPLASFDLGTSDGAIELTMPVAQAGMGVVFRMSDVSHYWKFTATPGTGNWTLSKVGGTAVTPVTTGTGSCCDPNALVGVYFDGTTIAVTVDGVAAAVATDAEYTANTRVGLVATASGSGRISHFAASGLEGTKSWFGYDANGNNRYNIDANLHTSTTTFDEDDRPVDVERADTSTSSVTYDRNGQVLTSTDPAGAVTTYSYDHQGRLASETRPGMSATSYAYSYDPGGEEVVVTEPGGVAVTTTFDGAGRPDVVDYSDATPDVSFGYDDDGRRTSMTTGSSPASSWEYDSLGRLNASERDGRRVTYGYDRNGNNTSISYPGSGTLIRHFDSASRLDSITDWNAKTTSFGYDADSNHRTTTFPNGVVTTNSFDVEGRPGNIVVKKGATTLAGFAQVFDSQSQVTSVTASGIGSSQSYGYNALDQLVANNATTIGYDQADNLAQLGATTRQRFNSSSQLCWSTGAWTPTGDYANPCATLPGWSFKYTFDARGNRTKSTYPFATDKVYAYDAANRLTGFSQGTTTVASYLYDGDGLRLSKTVNAATTAYTWNDATSPGLLLQDGTDDYLYGPGGEPVARVDAVGATTYLHQDHLGSTRLLTDAAGAKAGSYSYSPYGTVAAHTGATVALQYAGQYTDAETGLQYLRARYYDPTTGQFLTQDPLVATTGEPYGYTNGNPTNNTDPTGLELCPNGDWKVKGKNCGPGVETNGSMTYTGSPVEAPDCDDPNHDHGQGSSSGSHLDNNGNVRPANAPISRGEPEPSDWTLDDLVRIGQTVSTALSCVAGAIVGSGVGGFLGSVATSGAGFWGAIPGAVAGGVIGCALFTVDVSQPAGNP